MTSKKEADLKFEIKVVDMDEPMKVKAQEVD